MERGGVQQTGVSAQKALSSPCQAKDHRTGQGQGEYVGKKLLDGQAQSNKSCIENE